jgi:HPt (histidine-containing phosphotransfer) domain-containing protein
MDAYVSKPLRPEELFAVMDACCGEPSAAALERKPPARPRRKRTPAADGAAAAVDRAALVAAFGGNEKLLADTGRVFLSDAPAMLRRIQAGLEAGDLSEVAAAAHALKGASGLFSQGAAFEQARRLERLAKEGDRTALPVVKQDLDRAMTALTTALEAMIR